MTAARPRRTIAAAARLNRELILTLREAEEAAPGTLSAQEIEAIAPSA